MINQTIPDKCIWTISQVAGGYLIKNKATDKYLYNNSSNNSIYTASLASIGTQQYYSQVWRIENYDYCLSNQIDDFVPQRTLSLIKNESKGIDINIFCSGSNPLWGGVMDYEYTGDFASDITLNYKNGKFSMNSNYNSYSIRTVTIKHKPTGKTKTFKIVTKPNFCMIGIPAGRGHDHSSCKDDIEEIMGDANTSAECICVTLL